MNISLVTETYPPEINGVAMTLSHLVEGLAQRGHAMTVLRPRQSPADYAMDSPGVREKLFKGFSIPGYPLLKLGYPAQAKLKRLWSCERPDLVHIATEGPLGYSALRAATALKIPISSTFHTNFHSYSKHYGLPFLSRLALAYLRHFHNRTRITLSPTNELNAMLEADGFTNMRLLARGVNSKVFSPERRQVALRQRYRVAGDGLLVVHVSRLAPEKNYPLLFEAFAAIRHAVPSAQFVVVSDGPLRRRLTKSHPHVHFTGFISREDLAAHYASADLFVYASLTETFGNVVTEAMASGLPVVAFNYAAPARYIRHLENGYLAHIEKPMSLIDGAVLLATSPELRETLRKEARRTAEGISWETVIDGFERDLRAVVAAAAHGPDRK